MGGEMSVGDSTVWVPTARQRSWVDWSLVLVDGTAWVVGCELGLMVVVVCGKSWVGIIR